MKTLGCLVVIIVVCVGIFWLTNSPGLSDEDKARVAGEKVHRGWNRMRDRARDFQEGWKSVDDNTKEDKKSRR